jgi:HEAT repeat protein
MAARGFDAELAQLEQLRHADPSTTKGPLNKALGSKSNFIVGKAAALVAAHRHVSLVPDLVASFHRFLVDSSKSDPQCWAKEAIAKALAELDFQEPDVFITGMRTFQPGFTDDAATALRGTCALALVNCRTLRGTNVLEHLLPLFADPQTSVRVNAIRAVEQLGTESCSLLLRLRAELGSDSPEVLGACYSGVLRIEGPSANSWVGKFLRPEEPDDASNEAAFAIAETRSETAFNLLHQAFDTTRDADFKDALLSAIALTRQDKAIDFLFDLVAQGNRSAREAIENSAPSTITLERLRNLPC